MLDAAGHPIDFADTGEGPVLLFVPGSYSHMAAWRPVQRLLRPGLRLVTTSLRGYGNSRETRSRRDPAMHHEVELVRAVAAHIGEPVHLVGHSFGATVALAAALSRSFPVASLSLFEANPLNLVRDQHGAQHYRQTLEMSRDFEAAVQAGEADAPGRIIDFWGGAGAFAALPEAVKAYCRECAGTNVLDWHCAFGFGITAADCSSLDLPVLLVRGARANEVMKAITQTLERALPRPRPVVVETAGHFLVSTHAEACARLLSSFIDEVRCTPGPPDWNDGSSAR